MSNLKSSLVLLVLLVVVSQFLVAMAVAQTSEAQAASALVTSENAVVSAYQAVSKAEESGANVSSLLVRLNEAGWFLSRGRIAYESRDFDSAFEFATQSQEKLNGLVADADALSETAFYEHYLDFLVNVVGSVIGTVAVVCVSFFAWFLLKRKYEKAGRTV
jgi:hypothetical protein